MIVTFAPRDPDRDYLAELRAWSACQARRSIEAGGPPAPPPTAEQARLAAEFRQAAQAAIESQVVMQKEDHHACDRAC